MKIKENATYSARNKKTGSMSIILAIDSSSKKVHADGAIASMNNYKNFKFRGKRSESEQKQIHKLKTINWN